MLYAGQYTGTLSQLSATHAAPGMNKFWRLVFEDSPGYTQLVIEFDHAIFVFDSPPHQSELVIEWVRQTLGKPVTQLWVSLVQNFTRAYNATMLKMFSLRITTMATPMGPKPS